MMQQVEEYQKELANLRGQLELLQESEKNAEEIAEELRSTRSRLEALESEVLGPMSYFSFFHQFVLSTTISA